MRANEMDKCVIDGVEVELSSGNVFKDLALHDAEELQTKSGLITQITAVIRKRELSPTAVANAIGFTPSELANSLLAKLSNLSERELMDCLNHLQQSPQ
ncbi:helix-turn-helix domain-containing protein [Candidimonas humi]|uniref:Helix-turn-helix domain-containing protein n=2 Tax=Candidimonas humi TaxID=683355 RepID=A0ABV8P0G1_9BURK|nr:helix-turn-helix domain-containing protein [Candidimonas humi]